MFSWDLIGIWWSFHVGFSLGCCCKLRTGKTPCFTGRLLVSSDQLLLSSIIKCGWLEIPDQNGCFKLGKSSNWSGFLSIAMFDSKRVMYSYFYHISRAEAPISNASSDWLYLILDTLSRCLKPLWLLLYVILIWRMYVRTQVYIRIHIYMNICTEV